MCASADLRKIICICCVLFLFFSTNDSFSQTRRSTRFLDQAKTFYQEGNGTEAEQYALRAINADTANVEAYLLLADIYDRQQNVAKETLVLEQIINLSGDDYPLAYRLLSNNYIASGQFNQALDLLKEYSKYKSRSDSAWLHQSMEYCYNALSLIENKHHIQISRLDSGINTTSNEYWPFISADDSTLYFTRLITHEQAFPFERLFYSTRVDNNWGEAQKLTLGDILEVNEGTISITANGRLVFFTACGRPGGKGSCDIYYMYKKDGQWSRPVNAADINTGGWEAQPSVSAHGDRIFWSSNRSGGYGGKDIWEASIDQQENGLLVFGEPRNAGAKVNTRADDFSPFIHADNQTLYFSSTGHMGLGGSDIFMSRFDGENWGEAQNMGYPVNSIYNDDGMVISPTAHVALMSSDREGSRSGIKDIYMLELPAEFKPLEAGYVKGHVFNKHNMQKLSAPISLNNLTDSTSLSIHAEAETGYIAILQSQKSYAFNVSVQGYLFFSQRFEHEIGTHFNNSRVYNIYLTPVSVNENVILQNVLFEHDSYTLNPESEAELMQIVSFLQMNRNLAVEITGHTDNVGSKTYNLLLSENRAKAIHDYLVQYIEHDRISYKGYGDSQPVADNDTDEGRRQNRRSEMQIIRID